MTKKELLERARELDVAGRTSMNEEELAAAIADAQAAHAGGPAIDPSTEFDLAPGTPEQVGRPELVEVAEERAATRRQRRRRVIGDSGEEE